MLIKTKALKGYAIQNPEDETIGKVQDTYFDDRHWTLRYLVVNTGKWLIGRQVLISPYAVMSVNRDQKSIVSDLTKKQIEESPTLESHKPVSRQFEESYYDYYDWPRYWGGPNIWGYYPYLERNSVKWDSFVPDEKKYDHHLRSSHEVTGYHIQAEDGEIGHVADFVIDEQTWVIRYLVVNTSNWWAGKKVLVSPQWIERISWGERRVFVNVPRASIQLSPEYNDKSLLSRDYETRLHGHYQRKAYWADELVNL